MDFQELLRNRRSVRKYSKEDISPAELDRILQAGLLAPSSRDRRPVEFIVIREKAALAQLYLAKTTGSGMLPTANAAIVVIGNAARSDAWIEDCSIAMILMQLQAEELGIGSCWVQCRGRVSQQKRGEAIPATAGVPAADGVPEENMSSDEYLHALLGIPDNYSVEAILSLGRPDQETQRHEIPSVDTAKIHRERF